VGLNGRAVQVHIAHQDRDHEGSRPKPASFIYVRSMECFLMVSSMTECDMLEPTWDSGFLE
jgi:hypothetical protein